MYKNILVPVAIDHNEHLGEALALASSLRAEGGKITMLHVMESIPGYVATYISDDIHEKNVQAAHDALAELAVEASVPAEVRIVSGHSGRTILDFVEEEKQDLIIIASHRPGLQDYFLGSTAAHVVRHARCNVLVVR